MWIEGEMKEARVFEPNLVLRRRIEFQARREKDQDNR